MASFANTKRPHVVCVPYPAQGHITPMLKLAKLVHHKGFYVTFVNTEFNHKRLLRSNGSHSLDGLPDFRFETIPDGLPSSDHDATQHVPSLCASTSKNCSAPFRGLINKINASIDGVPPVTCIVSDGIMSFTFAVAEELGIPDVLFWTASACGFMCYIHYHQLVKRGYTPLKGDSVNLPEDFLSEIKDRGMIANWCPQEKVLKHRAIGGFLTHSGWNSMLESVCAGVPVICWPFFAEQQTNCRYSCIEWEMGMEISDLKRSEVEVLVRELMDGEKGKKMKLKAMNWKKEAEKAASPGGSSCINLNKLFSEVLFAPNSKVENDRVPSNLGILSQVNKII